MVGLPYIVLEHCTVFTTAQFLAFSQNPNAHYTQLRPARHYVDLLWICLQLVRQICNYRCKAKPDVSPPGCATSRLRSANQLSFLPYANATYRTSPELNFNSVDKANKNWLPRQRALKDQKTNFRLIIYSQILPTPANFAKVGAVDVDIIGLKKIVKMRNSSRIDSLSGPLSRAC